MPIGKKDDSGGVVTVPEIHQQHMRFNVVGTSPLIPHAVSFKAAASLLEPPPRKNAAEKATTFKHEPFEEFRDAAYQFTDEEIDSLKSQTRLYMPAGAFHGTMAQAAIDMAGAKKAQIGRLTSVPGLKVPIYGTPKIFCCIVRSSDMARTPDVRTLPIIPQWCAIVDVLFVGSIVKDQSIVNLLSAAGVFVGIGDGRPEKGKLTFGKFRLAQDDDPELLQILKTGIREAQDKAMSDPQFYDRETERLLTWFPAERARRVATMAPSLRKKPTPTVEPEVAAAEVAKKKKSGNTKHTRA